MQGVDASRFRDDRTQLGPLLENFAVMELKKQVAWSRRVPQLFHFRTSEGREVDLVLEEDGAKRGGSRTAIVRPTVYAAGFRFSVNVTR